MEVIHTFVVLAYKESEYLEDCIKSVLNQKYKSKVVIATSTPNDFIKKLAKKYDLEVIENKKSEGIGRDFDFAIETGQTKLVTVAHQDDIYDYEYSAKVVERYQRYPNSSIIFTDYYEIKNNKKELTNTNLKIKRILLFPLGKRAHSKFRKRCALRLGCAICCPAVTFNKDLVTTPVFNCHFKCDVDWYAWEKLSRKKGDFAFVKDKLMGHRVHEQSTTTEIIKDNIRTKEDLEMLKKFWPTPIAKLINHFYKNGEKSNNV